MTLTFERRPWCYFLPSHSEFGEASPYGRVDPDGRHYVLQADGPEHEAKVPVGFDLSFVYPSRLFVIATDDEGQDVPWDVLRKLLKERLGLRDCWDEVLSWRGMKGGRLTFYKALRAETQFGPNFSDVIKWMGNTPQNGDDMQWWNEGNAFVLWLKETTNQQ